MKSTRDAFAKLLCRNQLRERFQATYSFQDFEQWQETLAEVLKRRNRDREDDLDLEGPIRTTHWGNWESRKFFSMENGYLGCGPMDILLGDVVLGLYCPLVIRPAGAGKYRVVGGCYIQGLMDSESLLGQLPENWIVRQHNVAGRFRPRYYNTATEDEEIDDPRLGPIEKKWQRVERELTADFFENRETGEMVNYDPRLSVEALRRRGVALSAIRLVWINKGLRY